MGNHKDLEEGAALKLDWTKLDKVASKHCDVVPVVVQDSRSLRVLIAAYVNEKALAETFERRVCCLWSTSRNELWVKGATSGDTLNLDAVFVNVKTGFPTHLARIVSSGTQHSAHPQRSSLSPVLAVRAELAPLPCDPTAQGRMPHQRPKHGRVAHLVLLPACLPTGRRDAQTITLPGATRSSCERSRMGAHRSACDGCRPRVCSCNRCCAPEEVSIHRVSGQPNDA